MSDSEFTDIDFDNLITNIRCLADDQIIIIYMLVKEFGRSI